MKVSLVAGAFGAASLIAAGLLPPVEGVSEPVYGLECLEQAEVLLGDVLVGADYSESVLADWVGFTREACLHFGEYAEVTLFEDHSTVVSDPVSGVFWSYPSLSE